MPKDFNQMPVDTTAYSLSSQCPGPPERRDGERQLTLLRVGAMEVEGRRELCLIKNISEGGMRIRPYCPLTEGSALTVELKTGTSVPCRVAWVREDIVGVAFETPIDVVEILSKSQIGPKPRMPRIEVDCTAMVREGAKLHRLRTCDVSQGGIKAAIEMPLDPGCDLVVSLPGLEPQAAAVRWQDGGFVGITFNRLLPLPELVEWLHAMRATLRAA